MSKLIQPPPKFTHGEWTHSNHSNYNTAEHQRAAAERLIDESDRLIDETDETTKKTQRDVNKKFGKFIIKIIKDRSGGIQQVAISSILVIISFSSA